MEPSLRRRAACVGDYTGHLLPSPGSSYDSAIPTSKEQGSRDDLFPLCPFFNTPTMQLTYFDASRVPHCAGWVLSALLGFSLAPTALAKDANADVGSRVEPAVIELTQREDTISRLKAVIAKHSGKGGSVSLRVGGQVIAASDNHRATPAAADGAHGINAHFIRKPRTKMPKATSPSWPGTSDSGLETH